MFTQQSNLNALSSKIEVTGKSRFRILDEPETIGQGQVAYVRQVNDLWVKVQRNVLVVKFPDGTRQRIQLPDRECEVLVVREAQSIPGVTVADLKQNLENNKAVMQQRVTEQVAETDSVLNDVIAQENGEPVEED